MNIETIEKAYDAGNGNWSECDWTHIINDEFYDTTLSVGFVERGSKQIGEMDQNDSDAYRLTAKHFGLDLDEMSDADGVSQLNDEQSEVFSTYCRLVERVDTYLDKVKDDAAEAQSEADSAIEAAREGNLGLALDHAQRACNIEANYGDCPTWRAFRDAIEEAMDDAEVTA